MPNHIDDIFKAGLENYQIDPEPVVWSGLSKSLTSKEGKVILPWYFNPKKTILVALLVSMASFGGGYFYALFNDGTGQNARIESIPVERKVASIPSRPYQLNKGQLAYQQLSDIGSSNEESHPVTSNVSSLSVSEVSSTRRSDNTRPLNQFFNTTSQKSHTSQRSHEPLLFSATPVALLLEKEHELSNPQTIDVETNISSVLPISELNKVLNKRDFKKHFISIGYQRNQTAEGRLSYDFRTNSKQTWSESTEAIDVKFGVNFTKNIGLATGVAVHQDHFTFVNQEYFYPLPGNNAIPSEPISPEFTYGFSRTDLEIPVAVRIQGRNNFIGYHTVTGASLMSQIQSDRTFSSSELGFNSRDASGLQAVYNPQGRFNLYGSAGVDFYLLKNAGISFDAVLRKRLQATFLRNEFESDDYVLGAQMSAFIKF